MPCEFAMHTYIYLPTTGLLRKRLDIDPVLTLVGYCVGNTYIVVDYLPHIPVDVAEIDPELRTLGYLIKDRNISVTEENASDIILRYVNGYKYPIVDSKLSLSNHSFTVIIFSPPKLQNLEYFTINPILLQGAEAEPQIDFLYKSIARHRRYSEISPVVYLSDLSVLERINHCQETRTELGSILSNLNSSPFRKLLIFPSFFKAFLSLLMSIAQWLITRALSLFVTIVALLNSEIYGVVPVEISSLCRQLNLRLKQLSFLPIQFLCYYKGDVLSSQSRHLLLLSFPNENHNIKNSNYINFYNTLWLMLNDMILGGLFYSIWKDNKEFFASQIQSFNSIAFGELNILISWVGSNHPAGFKLNDDLGRFMEAMLLWTSLSWQLMTEICWQIYEAFPILQSLSGHFFSFLCFWGFSFALAFFIDYMKFVSLHISFFNLSTCKIYHQQVEMLKSLMQLFRGKKYNVLRSRIDSIEEDDYRIDQLLLGTFCFIILIYLLPTTFAFYFLFYAACVALLTLTKLGEKVIAIINFFPIFILTLKLKNSRRLQGGIYFQSKGSFKETNWLVMRNRALTLENILSPFFIIFRKQGRINRGFFNFIAGKRVEVEECTQEKFKYLMLPDDYSHLTEVWQSIQ